MPVKVKRPVILFLKDIQKEDKTDGRINSGAVGFLTCSIFRFVFFWQMKASFLNVKQIDTLPSLPEKKHSSAAGRVEITSLKNAIL